MSGMRNVLEEAHVQLLASEHTDSPRTPVIAGRSVSRRALYGFLEEWTLPAKAFKVFIYTIILVNGTVFLLSTEPEGTEPRELVDDLGLEYFFDLCEFISVIIFSIEYVARAWCIVERDLPPARQSFLGVWKSRLLYLTTDFFIVMDLVAVLPFYMDMFTVGHTFSNMLWVRVVRFLYLLPGLPYGQIWTKSKALLLASGFAGMTVWVICASLYFFFERHNPLMNYCPYGEDIPDDAQLPDPKYPRCYNRFESIPMAMYFSLLNFFGEFPLIDSHSTGGRFVGGFIQLAGAAVVAIPAGALGNAFSDLVDEIKGGGDDDDKDGDDGDSDGGKDDKKDDDGKKDDDEKKEGGVYDNSVEIAALTLPLVGRLETPQLMDCMKAVDGVTDVVMLPHGLGEIDAGHFYRGFSFFLVAISTLHFILASLTEFPGGLGQTVVLLFVFDCLASAVFIVEYLFRVYAARLGGYESRVAYAKSPYGVIDFVAGFLPAIELMFPCLRGVRATRILKLERFVEAFRAFNDIICENSPILVVTFGVSMVSWFFFSAGMYYSERHNPDDSMSQWYTSVGNAMWITLLNLSGEAPLCDYTFPGRVITGVMGLFGVGIVSIPMGLLGGAFQDWLAGVDAEEDAKAIKMWKENDQAIWNGVLGKIVKINMGKEGDDDDDDDETKNTIVLEFENGTRSDLLGVCDVKKPTDAEIAQFAKAKKTIAATSGLMADTKNLTPRQLVAKFVAGSAENELEDLDPAEGWAVRFEQVIFLAIFTNVVLVAMQTIPWFSPPGSYMAIAGKCIEMFSVVLFSIEYILRCYTAPEDDHWEGVGYTTDGAKRWAHIMSWSSLIDLFAIMPYYVSLAGSTSMARYNGELRMLRVFRLLTLDKYIPSVSLIGRVFRKNADQFKLAGFAAFSFWIIFATLLWFTERHDTDNVNGIRMDQRYGTVLSAMPYTLVHLTGDFPLTNYTLESRFVLWWAVFAAVGVVSVPASLLASGFATELKAFRKEGRQQRMAAQGTIEKHIRSFLARRRLMKAVKSAVSQDKEQKRKQKQAEKANDAQYQVVRFLEKKTNFGRYFSYFMFVLILLNVLAVLIESMRTVYGVYVSVSVMASFEWFSVMIFTTMYVLQIWSAPKNVAMGFQRSNYIWSFWGVVDFITVAPFWIEQVLLICGIPFDGMVFRVIRLLRILQFEDFVSAFTLLDDAWYNCRDSMVACGFMAMLVWICGSILFYECEKDNPDMGGAFGTLPSSMYYSVIFLGGEWGKIDFTPWGKVVCVFYLVAGIGIYGIPVGAVFEAFADVLAKNEGDDGEAKKEEEDPGKPLMG